MQDLGLRFWFNVNLLCQQVAADFVLAYRQRLLSPFGISLHEGPVRGFPERAERDQLLGSIDASSTRFPGAQPLEHVARDVGQAPSLARDPFLEYRIPDVRVGQQLASVKRRSAAQL